MDLKLLTTLIALQAAQVHADELPALKTTGGKLNYGIGVEMGRNLKNQGVEVNQDLLMQGLKDGLSGGKILIPEKELRKILISFQNELRQKQAVAKKVAAMDNQKKGAMFLAENKAKPDVVTLPSGLQYTIIKAGDGRKPTDDDAVECTYRGTHIDGTEFDRSLPGQSSDIKVSSVIPGWREALKLMPAGSTWRLFIPPQLAYGERGKGNTVEPNETLIFEIEVLSVK